MRFCHLSTFYPPWSYGGDGILVQQICEGLARRGHHVDIVHCEDAFRLKRRPAPPKPVDPSGVHRHVLHSKWGFLSLLITQQTGRPGPKRRSLREILAEPYDVVHFHNVSLLGGLGVLELSRAPVTLYTTHDHWLVCPTHVLWKYGRRPCDSRQCLRCSLVSGTPPQFWRYGGWAQRCLEHIDVLLSPSRFTADKHREGGVTQPIRVMNSFSRPMPAPGATDFRTQQPLFVYAGRVEASKGVQDLVLAFRERPRYELAIAGEGSLLDRLRLEAADCPNIRLLGVLPHGELASLYEAATAVVSPTWGPEAFPLVNIEALSCGTPVIGRRAGGSVEAIERTGGGLIYEQPDELLPLVDRLASDPALREKLGRLAAEGYAQFYSEDVWMTEYFRVIDEIASSGNGTFAKVSNEGPNKGPS
jgi:glycosyltransferase involved in cell wall biosynthesis